MKKAKKKQEKIIKRFECFDCFGIQPKSCDCAKIQPISGKITISKPEKIIWYE